MESIGENDPRMARIRKARADGAILPFSIEEQWQQVENWHALLEHERGNSDSGYNLLNEAWDAISEGDLSPAERGSELRPTACTPIEALSYLIGMGFYPPPELLLAIADCIDTYMANGGSMTLEEAFFGRPKKSAGNHAKRSESRTRKIALKWRFIEYLRAGNSRIQAAEMVSELFNHSIDADSVLRMVRGVTVPTKKPDQ